MKYTCYEMICYEIRCYEISLLWNECYEIIAMKWVAMKWSTPKISTINFLKLGRNHDPVCSGSRNFSETGKLMMKTM